MYLEGSGKISANTNIQIRSGEGSGRRRRPVSVGVISAYKQYIINSEMIEWNSARICISTIQMQPTLPSIAIASGPSVLIYKNLKPFYKFNVPTLDVDETENEAWSHAEASQIDSTQLYAVLSKLTEKVSRKSYSSVILI